MPGDPNECREHAKRCLQIAAETTSVLAKVRFEELAKKWTYLATDLDHAKALVEHWGHGNFKPGKVG